MVRVAEHQLAAQILQLLRGEALERTLRPHGHEDGRLHHTVTWSVSKASSLRTGAPVGQSQDGGTGAGGGALGNDTEGEGGGDAVRELGSHAPLSQNATFARPSQHSR